MEETHLYRQVSEDIRRQILQGELKPGDRLPSVREMSALWGCTVGTIQRAYQELVHQGLVITHAGQGTRVVERVKGQQSTPLRRAALVHRAEAFLLEVLTSGYAPSEVEDAVRQALERWRVVSQEQTEPSGYSLRFAGSHDLVVAWLATHFAELVPGFTLVLSFSGSLGGLIALAEAKADLAGCHLWDEESEDYNIPFVRRLLPGERVALVTLAHRRIGLVTPPGNPANLHTLADLARPGLRFVNRQPGSGTRVWLDASLRKLGIDTQAIQGYSDEKMTHSDVARAVAEGQADVGLGLEAVVRTYGLGFEMLTQERYDFAIPAGNMQLPALQKLVKWLGTPEAKNTISQVGGYLVQETGQLRWVD
jgi:molybdate-binding protein/DNA-binding transcriptional regulator YhcF (GntR family)